MSIPIISSRQLDLGLSQFFEPRPELTPGNQITVEPGWMKYEGTFLIKVQQTSPAFGPVSGAGKVRWDLVYLDSSAVPQVTAGAEQSTPVADFTGAPIPTAFQVPVAYVEVDEAAGVTVNADNITDIRTFQSVYAANHNTMLLPQGGTAGQYYHTTLNENGAIVNANAPTAGNYFRTLNDLPASHGNSQHSSTFKVDGTMPTIHSNSQHSVAYAALTDPRFSTTNEKAALGAAPNPLTAVNPVTDKTYVDGLLAASSGKLHNIYYAANSNIIPIGIGTTETIVSVVVPTPSPLTLVHYILCGSNQLGGSCRPEIYDGVAVLADTTSAAVGVHHPIALLAEKTGVTAAVTYTFRKFSTAGAILNNNGNNNANWIAVFAVKP